MTLGLATYNNLEANDEWKGGSNKKLKQSPSDSQEKNFLALATEILQQAKAGKVEQSSSEGTSDGGIRLKNGRELKAWRFENPKNEKSKTLKDGTIMKWCTNNCHPKPMWCGRKNCLNREEYAAKYGSKSKPDENVRQQEDKKPAVISDDFKIALAAMTSNQDYETLKSQFFSGN